jgi:hypothetical protein
MTLSKPDFSFLNASNIREPGRQQAHQSAAANRSITATAKSIRETNAL